MRSLGAVIVATIFFACGSGGGSPAGSDAGAGEQCLNGTPGTPGESGLPCPGMPSPGGNASATTAAPLPSSQCGALTATVSQAWFSIAVGQAGTWLAFAANAQGDAVFTLQAPDGTRTPIQGRAVVCGARSGTYLVEVASPSRAAQDYAINWGE